MAVVLKWVYSTYQHSFLEQRDPRNADYLLMEPPWAAAAILAVYLYFVLSWGPKFMERRQPYNIRRILLAYNLFQVVANAELFLQALLFLKVHPFSFTCQSINYSDSTAAMLELKLIHRYFMLKLLDLLDTVFFVLRKKQNHITFLHVYHHTFIFLGAYICNRFVPGGHGSMLGILNTFVHAIMYGYFFISVYRPAWTKNTSLKKYVTIVQMVQFAYLIVHFARPLIWKYEDCNYPRFWCAAALIQNVFMLLMFLDFYLRAYHKKK